MSELPEVVEVNEHCGKKKRETSRVRYSSSSRNPVYARYLNSSYLGSSLSSHRQSYIGLIFSSRFIDLIINKKKNPVSTNRLSQ
jgi:hypothetical protein